LLEKKNGETVAIVFKVKRPWKDHDRYWMFL